jgi:DnaJ-class molecular chaperone
MSKQRPEGTETCPDCGGTGIRQIPMTDDWGDVEFYLEKRCSFCGGDGWFDAEQAAEMKAEMGMAGWYDLGGEY